MQFDNCYSLHTLRSLMIEQTLAKWTPLVESYLFRCQCDKIPALQHSIHCVLLSTSLSILRLLRTGHLSEHLFGFLQHYEL